MTQPDGSSSSDPSLLNQVAGAVAGGVAAAGGAGPAASADVAAAGATGTLDDLTAQAVASGESAVKGLDPMAALAAGLGAISAPAMQIGKVADWIFKLSLPTTWIRVCSYIAAAFFLACGIVLLTREMRNK